MNGELVISDQRETIYGLDGRKGKKKNTLLFIEKELIVKVLRKACVERHEDEDRDFALVRSHVWMGKKNR